MAQLTIPVRRSDNAAQRRVIDAIATGMLWASAIAVVVLLAFFIGYLFYLGA